MRENKDKKAHETWVFLLCPLSRFNDFRQRRHRPEYATPSTTTLEACIDNLTQRGHGAKEQPIVATQFRERGNGTENALGVGSRSK